MKAIEVSNLGVAFRLSGLRGTTLREAFVNLVSRNRRARREIIAEQERHWALREVSFTVEQGECFGVVGRNGSGKSTLLQMLSGVFRPDEGAVKRQGSVGLLQLGTGFHEELTGRDNIYLSGAILGMKRREIDAIFESIVSFCELGRFIDLPLKTYSSGMTARLGFAVAINLKTDILLIDEVLAVGDERFKGKCRVELEKIRRQGRTIVIVSHSMGEIRSLCDRAICLNEGRLACKGPSEEVVSYYSENFGR